MAAARTIWLMEHTTRVGTLDLKRYRPWYRHKVAPSQLDVLILGREALHAEGISPIIRLDHTLDEMQQRSEKERRLAASRAKLMIRAKELTRYAFVRRHRPPG